MWELRRHRITVWSLVVFVLLLAVPGWYIQMRLAEKVNRLENRVTELEEHLAQIQQESPPVAATKE